MTLFHLFRRLTDETAGERNHPRSSRFEAWEPRKRCISSSRKVPVESFEIWTDMTRLGPRLKPKRSELGEVNNNKTTNNSLKPLFPFISDTEFKLTSRHEHRMRNSCMPCIGDNLILSCIMRLGTGGSFRFLINNTTPSTTKPFPMIESSWRDLRKKLTAKGDDGVALSERPRRRRFALINSGIFFLYGTDVKQFSGSDSNAPVRSMKISTED